MKRIAVVGAGVSGLTAAYRLADKFDVTLFEKGNYLGGHVHTHQLEIDGQKRAVDSGFIVYNDRTYPQFMALLKE
ncbi:MAG: FAD-dependent oxidoreductase, partial [SAR86 cluster bacterium]